MQGLLICQEKTLDSWRAQSEIENPETRCLHQHHLNVTNKPLTPSSHQPPGTMCSH